MNARFRMSIVTLCIAGALAGCGSVTGGTSFQPPAGWTGTPAMFGRLQMWMKGSKNKGDVPQILMLIKGDKNNMKADFTDVPPQYSKNTKIIKQGSTKICGGSQQADQFIGEGTSNDGKKTEIEMISTVIGKDRYLAMYIRPQSVSADKDAETAIHSLCPAATK